jgi:hypothetical protein
MKRIAISCLSLLLASELAAFAAPHLGADEVIRIADAEVRRHGQDPNAYQRPPGYNYGLREDLWRVFYNRKEATKTFTPHVVFVVTIADKTKQTTFTRASKTNK